MNKKELDKLFAYATSKGVMIYAIEEDNPAIGNGNVKAYGTLVNELTEETINKAAEHGSRQLYWANTEFYNQQVSMQDKMQKQIQKALVIQHGLNIMFYVFCGMVGAGLFKLLEGWS